MPSHLFVSTQLFPESLVGRVCEEMCGHCSIQMSRVDQDTVVLSMEPYSEQLIRQFKHRLTRKAVEFFAPWMTQDPVPDQHPTLTFDLPDRSVQMQVRERGEGNQLVLSIKCTEISWLQLLRMIASIPGAAVAIESTRPMDRYVVTLEDNGALPLDQLVSRVFSLLYVSV